VAQHQQPAHARRAGGGADGGQADIARETQDLRVVVVPEINAGTASLAYAAINPAVGLGTFLAQRCSCAPADRRPARASSTSAGLGRPQGREGRAQVRRRRARHRCHPAGGLGAPRCRAMKEPDAMKIAALQMVSTPVSTDNLEASAPPDRQAAPPGATLVALPEYFCLMGHATRQARHRRGAGRGTDPGMLSGGARARACG
jgi:hypothetical protein